MTNQEDFKKDTQELWAKLGAYKNRYRFMLGDKSNTPIELVHAQLRQFLEIVWDNETIKEQRQRDLYC